MGGWGPAVASPGPSPTLKLGGRGGRKLPGARGTFARPHCGNTRYTVSSFAPMCAYPRGSVGRAAEGWKVSVPPHLSGGLAVASESWPRAADFRVAHCWLDLGLGLKALGPTLRCVGREGGLRRRSALARKRPQAPRGSVAQRSWRRHGRPRFRLGQVQAAALRGRGAATGESRATP